MSERDKKLILIIPALLVLVAYGLFIFRSKYTELGQTRAQAKTAAERVPKAAEVNAQIASFAAKVKDLDAVRQNRDTMQTRLRALTGDGARSSRPERIEQLNALLLRSGLVVIESTDNLSDPADAK